MNPTLSTCIGLKSLVDTCISLKFARVQLSAFWPEGQSLQLLTVFFSLIWMGGAQSFRPSLRCVLTLTYRSLRRSRGLPTLVFCQMIFFFLLFVVRGATQGNLAFSIGG